MAVSSSSNTQKILSNLSSGYTSKTQEEESSEDTLGRAQFLTLLVAQLENQDPLNPAEGTEFTSQLAQYSQLEQLMNLNDTMTGMTEAFQSSTESDGTSYIGKEVTGTIESLEVSKGSVTSGFYNLAQSADVIVEIYDADGTKVTRLYEGQKSSGGQLLSWDGTDSSGAAVTDGQYTYKVLANYGNGYQEVETSVTGTVEGVTYNNGTPYLVVQGVLVSIDDVTSVTEIDTNTDTESIMDYLGHNISSSAPIVLLEDGEVSGEDLTFDLEDGHEEEITVKIYDAYNELVNTITVSAEKLEEGTNSVHWNGCGSSGTKVSDGLYYYTVQTESGSYVPTEVSGEVGAIRTVNSVQYLELQDSGRLVSLSNVKKIY